MSVSDLPRKKHPSSSLGRPSERFITYRPSQFLSYLVQQTSFWRNSAGGQIYFCIANKPPVEKCVSSTRTFPPYLTNSIASLIQKLKFNSHLNSYWVFISKYIILFFKNRNSLNLFHFMYSLFQSFNTLLFHLNNCIITCGMTLVCHSCSDIKGWHSDISGQIV